jgi:hypothetical protein
MTKITLALASAATLALAASAAYAQAPARPDNGADLTRAQVQTSTAEMFTKLDANKDGTFDAADRTLLEAQRTQQQAERQHARFEQLDTDKNGSLSRAEFDAALDHARDRVAGRGDGKRGPGGKGGPGGPGMGKLDGDKPITQAEFTAAALARFDRADTNRDGTVTAAERQAQRAERRAAPAKAQS